MEAFVGLPGWHADCASRLTIGGAVTVAEASFCIQGISVDVETIDRLE